MSPGGLLAHTGPWEGMLGEDLLATSGWLGELVGPLPHTHSNFVLLGGINFTNLRGC